ncbi:MAG: hypothetical protein CMG55_09115 [Candidatus Marinimicrobia bacterium]|nr:hypothetical protein [Candidatus Neomarinimicrobiota bacterium]
MKYILQFIFISFLMGQSKYPADTLITSSKITIIKKIGLLPISIWQRISYNSNYFNCQFYPSCSNYGASAINQFGIIHGSIIATERITRCNPFAIYYHTELNFPFKEDDGRLIDPIIYDRNLESKKSPILATTLSFIPGAGRFYAGRKLDGLMGLWTVYLTTSSAYYANKNKNPILGPFFLGIAGVTYFGEVYGGWRANKYYKKVKKNKI